VFRAWHSPLTVLWGSGTRLVCVTEEAAICSAKGCREPAGYALVWNNPKVHTPDREKVWTACEEHRESLSHHLAIRSFLRRVEPLEPGR
jgi:hypothetical protein